MKFVRAFSDEYKVSKEVIIMNEKEKVNIYSPVDGKVVPLSNINDPAFSNEEMGKTVAIDPSIGKLYAPANAKITFTYDSGHAYGMVTEDGIEILIHIGIDTVKMKGKGFVSKVKKGQKVNQGALLATFDIAKIKENKFSPVVLLIITNSKNFASVNIYPQDGQSIQSRDKVMAIEMDEVNSPSPKAVKSSNKELAQNIVRCIGGIKNISGLTHCATRLRINLKDRNKVDVEGLKQSDIIKLIVVGDQYQIVIGPQVGSVYDEIIKNTSINESETGTAAEQSNTNILGRIFDVISGSFTPLIPAFCGSGMIKALCSILLMSHVLTAKDSTYLILSAIGNGIFYFLPIILGVSIARKLKLNPYIAATIGAALLEPNFTSLLKVKSGVNFIGIPVVMNSYASSVLPIFGAVFIQYLTERTLKKYIPDQIHLVVVPVLTLLVVTPLTILIFGPFGIYLGNGLASLIKLLLSKSAILTGAILSMVWIYVVMMGLHWAILPIMINNIATTGTDPIMGLMINTVWISGGIALGAFLKSKDVKTKEVAFSGLIPCILSGVSEPILYGIIFKYKRALLYYSISGAILGALSGLMGMRSTQIAGGLFTIPTFSPLLGYLLVIALAFIIPTVLILVFGLGEESK